MNRKKWILSQYNKDFAAQLSEQLGLDPLAALLTSARGIDNIEDAKVFFEPEDTFHDPLEMKDMDKAVDRINAAIETGESIAIYGDYDADGVTSTAILYSYLEMHGANVQTFIPDRHEDGYGLNENSIAQMQQAGINLIITVDNGISALEEAEWIAQASMDLIVTDHHTPSENLPKAVAVINPHRKDCPYPFKDFAGVGVTFKLIEALEGDITSVLEEYADLVAIGTVADLVPLISENRIIVQQGLLQLQNSKRAGIRALLEKAGQQGKKISSTTIAFAIAPRINALGRIETAHKALELLLTDDMQMASALADEIQEVNQHRQGLEQNILKEIYAQLLRNPQKQYERVLVISGMDWHVGVIGIVASRIVERFSRPCIILSIDPAIGEVRGSGRSVEGFSLYDAIHSCEDLLIKHGGHPMAAGLTLHESNIADFESRIQTYASQEEMPFSSLHIDCRIRPNGLNLEILDIIEQLEPFGNANPQPVFGLYHMHITNIQPLSNGKHTKLILSRDGLSFPVLRFGLSPMQLGYRIGDEVDVAVTIESNEFRGEMQLSIKLCDIRPSQENHDDYFIHTRIYEKNSA